MKEKHGAAMAIARGRKILCSVVLSREFCETVASFEARNPEVVAFQNWFKQFESANAVSEQEIRAVWNRA
jgi:hypothetical protein